MTTANQPITESQTFRREFSGELARRLHQELALDEGFDLISVIGIGDESSNLEALETWVFIVCSELKLAFTNQHVGTLKCMLEAIINRATDADKPTVFNH